MASTMNDDEALDTLAQKVKDGEVEIRVEDTPIGKTPTVSTPGGFTLSQEEDRLIDALFDKYRDLFIELDDIESEHEQSSTDRFWEIGRAVSEHIIEDDDEPWEMKEIEKLFPLDMTRPELKRAKAIYRLYPDGNYDEDASYSVLEDIYYRTDTPEDGRRAYESVVEAGRTPTMRQARVLSDVDADDDLETIVEAVLDRLREDPSDEKIVESVENVYYMLGYDEAELPDADAILGAAE